jgi:AcrR family transcriptional regulator
VVTPANAGGEDGGQRARRERSDVVRNRNDVLDAARVVFAEQGIAAPLDEVARRAGVGAGTVYRHFPSKEALFEAVVRERLEQLLLTARACAEEDVSGAALFRAVDALVDQASRTKDVIDALRCEELGMRPAVADVVAELRDALGGMLSRAQASDLARADIDAAELLCLLFGAIFSAQWPTGRGIAARRAASVLCDGLRQRS